ncbi:hypothetical protein ADICYQ_5560 [Cyclobacterium qasimii M12-11B]|uniref:Uncharacterized protein n=1 Tax=Cyclobacterium qasimii M12-11B TaxID=641524 RepID=S7V635_9BACT|nr:hypothetical protein ADICYQ_5560 [Cyclobacterium qasimii M12-11B]
MTRFLKTYQKKLSLGCLFAPVLGDCFSYGKTSSSAGVFLWFLT